MDLPDTETVEPRAAPVTKFGILVVDDDERGLYLLCENLERLGFKAWPARNGLEAIKIYPRLRSDLSAILLDVDMPGLDGVQALKHFQSMEVHVPICFITGVNLYEEDELLELGARRVFRKPISLHQLASTLRRLGGD